MAVQSFAGVQADADRRTGVMHPAIEAALSAFDADSARRGRSVLGVLLGDRTQSDGERWRGSRLTGDGFPFELSFCTGDQRLRFTVEPGGPSLDPSKRLDAAVALLHEMDSPVPTDIVEMFRSVQLGARVDYGAWIGCRISPDDYTFKLYVEVPEQPDPRLPFAPPLTLPDRSVTTRMIGWSAGGALEWYVRVPSAEPRHLRAMLAPAGLDARADELAEFVRSAYGYPIRGRLPGPTVGVSYCTSQSDSRATLYLFARSLWGSDSRIRQQFLHWAPRQWNPNPYRAVSAPMATRSSWQTYHGLLGITVDPAGASVAIGVRPVAS